jgi:hypothetical protein
MRTTPELEVVRSPYDDTAMKSTSSARFIARTRSAMNGKLPLKIPTSSGSFSA